CQQYTNSPFRF
nr:immunoglobulin light chain junction region [Macaca mulatta]